MVKDSYRKTVLLFLFFSTFIGYMEWGGGNNTFIFSSEMQIISKFFINPQAVLHPLIIFPFVGQLLLMVALIIRSPGKWLIHSAILLSGILFIPILLSGLLSFNLKVVLSTLPFFIFSVIHFRVSRKKMFDN